LYKAALIVKKTERCGYKKQAKAKAQAAAAEESTRATES
jgi:hypothetical protein